MSRLLDVLSKNKFSLIVYLPENKPALAKLVEKLGADALLVKNDEMADLIVKAVRIPVGVDVETQKISVKKLKSLEGFDFVNFGLDALETFAKHKKGSRVVALDDKYTLDRLMQVENKADAVDATIISIRHLGKELVVGDLQNYIAIALSSGLPVMIPTQRKIKPSEVSIIWDTGAKGLLLTETVLGKDEKSIEKKFKEYKIAVDDLGA